MHFKPFYYMDAFMLRALRPQNHLQNLWVLNF